MIPLKVRNLLSIITTLPSTTPRSTSMNYTLSPQRKRKRSSPQDSPQFQISLDSDSESISDAESCVHHDGVPDEVVSAVRVLDPVPVAVHPQLDPERPIGIGRVPAVADIRFEIPSDPSEEMILLRLTNNMLVAARSGVLNQNLYSDRLCETQKSQKWSFGDTRLIFDHGLDFCMNVEMSIGFTLDKLEKLYLMKPITSRVQVFLDLYEVCDNTWHIVDSGNLVTLGSRTYGQLSEGMRIPPDNSNQFIIN